MYHQVLQPRILHGVHIACMCSIWISEQTATMSLYNINMLDFITEVESVYCAVRTESLHNTYTFRLQKFNLPVKLKFISGKIFFTLNDKDWNCYLLITSKNYVTTDKYFIFRVYIIL